MHPRLLVSVFVLFAFAASSGRAAEASSAAVRFGSERWVEYDVGELPIVLTAPHGGALRPSAIADRSWGVASSVKDTVVPGRAYDSNTLELARAIADELFARTGKRPHLIVSHLHRRKLDPNREIKEAAQGDRLAERAWTEFHGFITAALTDASRTPGFAFLIDIHGHGHTERRLELGYGLGARELNVTDAKFDAADYTAHSTVRDLYRRQGGSGAALIRGPGSFGDLFVQRGVRAVPSPKEPRPDNLPFFSGGYIVLRHSNDPAIPNVDAVQIESHSVGVRDNAASRAKFAKITADVILTFLRERYGFTAEKGN